MAELKERRPTHKNVNYLLSFLIIVFHPFEHKSAVTIVYVPVATHSITEIEKRRVLKGSKIEFPLTTDVGLSPTPQFFADS
jgi:hypothetical protein